MRRIERLINLIAALLETRDPMTASDIRDRVAGYDQTDNENFRRTFERDKEALRGMGIPLELRPTDPFVDQSDGYIIPKELYYLPQLDLEEDELAALRIAAGVVLGAGDAARSAFIKLSIDEPGGAGDGPGIVWGADLAAEQAALTPLHHALLARKPVRFGYVSAAGSREDRTVEPYGLLHRRGHWYLVGLDRDRDATRSFKVSRIDGAITTLDGTYEIPPGFDPVAHVAEGWEIGGAEEMPTVNVRFHPEMRWWAEQNLAHAPRESAPGDALDVDIAVANLDALVSWAIDLGEGVEILAPESARAALRARLDPWLGEGSSG